MSETSNRIDNSLLQLFLCCSKLKDRFNRQIITMASLIVFAAACTTTSIPVQMPSAAIPMQQSSTLALSVVPQTETFPQRTKRMKIRITLEEAVITASLGDSQTTRDFISLLPLTLTLEDYAGTEKISYLPQKLSTEDAPAGSDPAVGDITYYAPWGNLAIFYKDFGYADGLVILGKIDGNVEALNIPGPVEATIELLE